MSAPAHLTGIACMCVTALMWGLTDALAKWLTQSYPVLQVLWGRFFFNALIVVMVYLPRLSDVVRTQAPTLQIIRSLLVVVTVGVLFVSFQTLSLVTANAVFYMTPILVTVFAIPLLGERVDLRRWIGVLLGFAGAMLVIRPGSSVMQAAALLPLVAAGSSALYQIATRRTSFVDGAITNLLYAAIGGTLMTSLMLPFVWKTPDAQGWLILVGLGVTGGTAQLALIKGLEVAPASVIAPFHYTNLIWAAVLGYAIFGDVPDRWTISGGLVIVASGLYVIRRPPVSNGSDP